MDFHVPLKKQNAVGQMIKSINASTKKINELKNKIKTEKQSKKEAVKTITDFLNSNDLPKKIYHRNLHEFKKINDTYNLNYLEAEYQFAKSSA